MATIKAIEGRSVHQIQSGQVIVDLVSVVKELIENSLDAGATSIDVRFKNNGLDTVEVQDNGKGIAPEDFDSIALKHYTSKLSSFEDLDTLETFGFRGEALSSLSALAALHIVTARAEDGAVGKRLDFEPSGRLKDTTVVAAQKGTTVTVENLFHNLPVRRKELEKNIKREYNKVLSFLQSYACICVGVRLSVSNQMPKGKRMTAFSTKGNPTTKENVANVFGAKTLTALVKLDLTLQMEPGAGPTTQSARSWSTQPTDKTRKVLVQGHISKPGWGEGRQTPDRQMFYVNSRPCSLPQVTKVVNEVYRSFNHHQSPFIVANFVMDTTSYDVNVSPDKKTIMLHDQTALLDALKAELTNLFEDIDHSLPQTQLQAKPLPAFKPLSAPRRTSTTASESVDGAATLIADWASRETVARTESRSRGRAGSDGVATVLKKTQNIESGQSVDEPSPESQDDSNDATVYNHDVARPRAAPTQEPVIDQVPTPDAKQDGTGAVSSLSGGPPITSDARSAQSQSSEDEILDNDDESRSNAFDLLRQPSPDLVDRTTAKGCAAAAASWHKRRKLNIIKRGAPLDDEAHSSNLSDLTQFAAPGSQLQLSFSKQRSTHIQEEPHGPDDCNDTFTAGDSTPELSFEQTSQAMNRDQPGIAPTADTEDALLAEEIAKKLQEDEAVARLIHTAEHDPAGISSSVANRGLFTSQQINSRRDATYNLTTRVSTSIEQLTKLSTKADRSLDPERRSSTASNGAEEHLDAESRLSLTVSKADFDRMEVVGQFNLGFILALRPASSDTGQDELFIIDQHAADEKYNYERLQSTVVLQSQRLVRPITLELSAVEQEVVYNHQAALKANGFEVEITDDEGPDAVTQTFRLLTLPMINQKTFQLSDLEELLHLLSDLPSGSNDIPRPRKVQRMLAMRACRSSIMVGKTLTHNQMSRVVTHMGGMDKPWNCPHGRPTMRHLYKLNGWHTWHEYDDFENEEASETENVLDNWKAWLERKA